MLHSHFKVTYLLCIIICISTVSAVSFGDICSHDLSCQYPLICSNSSKCICPLSSFWNTKHNTCLSCSPGSIEWKNEKCLLFIGSHENGLIYQKASNNCLEHSTQLLQINNHEDFIEFQYKIRRLLENQYSNILTDFLSNGFWINFTDKETSAYNWCDREYETDVFSLDNCIRMIEISSKNNNDISLCINHMSCYEKLSYICESTLLFMHCYIGLVQSNSYNWCDHEDIDETLLSSDCVRVMNKYSQRDNVVSLCTSPVSCYEKLPYICERPATSLKDKDQIRAIGDPVLGSSSVDGAMGSLVNVLVSSMQKPTLPPEAYRPQINFIQIPVQAQRSSLFSTRNIILYVVLMIIVIAIIIIVLLFCAGGFLFMRTNNKDSLTELETKETESQEVEPIETPSKEIEPKEVEIPIETKPEPTTQSSSRHISASFDTTDFE